MLGILKLVLCNRRNIIISGCRKFYKRRNNQVEFDRPGERSPE